MERDVNAKLQILILDSINRIRQCITQSNKDNLILLNKNSINITTNFSNSYDKFSDKYEISEDINSKVIKFIKDTQTNMPNVELDITSTITLIDFLHEMLSDLNNLSEEVRKSNFSATSEDPFMILK